VERLFGLAILTDRYRKTLHGVLLPRSWILALWKDFVTFKDRALAPLLDLVHSTESLMKDVHTGEYLRDTIIFESFGEFVRYSTNMNVTDIFKAGLTARTRWTIFQKTSRGNFFKTFASLACKCADFNSKSCRWLISVANNKMQVPLSA
jgi:hypothetical protein